MTNLETIALAKAAGKAAESANKLAVGLHLVDFITTVRVAGTLKKQEDFECTPGLPLAISVALAFRLADISRERAKEILPKLIEQAYAAGENGADADLAERVADFDAAQEQVKAAVELPKKPRSGSVIASLVLRELETPAAAEVKIDKRRGPRRKAA